MSPAHRASASRRRSPGTTSPRALRRRWPHTPPDRRPGRRPRRDAHELGVRRDARGDDRPVGAPHAQRATLSHAAHRAQLARTSAGQRAAAPRAPRRAPAHGADPSPSTPRPVVEPGHAPPGRRGSAQRGAGAATGRRRGPNGTRITSRSRARATSRRASAARHRSAAAPPSRGSCRRAGLPPPWPSGPGETVHPGAAGPPRSGRAQPRPRPRREPPRLPSRSIGGRPFPHCGDCGRQREGHRARPGTRDPLDAHHRAAAPGPRPGAARPVDPAPRSPAHGRRDRPGAAEQLGQGRARVRVAPGKQPSRGTRHAPVYRTCVRSANSRRQPDRAAANASDAVNTDRQRSSSVAGGLGGEHRLDPDGAQRRRVTSRRRRRSTRRGAGSSRST